MRCLAIVAALLLLSACASGTPGATPTNPASRFQTTEPLPSASTPSGFSATLSEARLGAIRADLAGRGVQTDQLRVVSAQSVTFNDGSLGCPAPGVQYTQAQVKGMQVVVEAAGRRFDYRFGAGDSPKLCERGGPAVSSATR
jgi:hypothetical protein